jgi:hypothetical protein
VGVEREGREPGTLANERLTAATGVALVALLLVEGVTILFLRPLLPVHIFVGMLLIPPVALKLAATGYRFVRYYTGNSAYVRRGPPSIVMRALAPVLVVATVGVLATGVSLLVLGPDSGRGIVLGLHKLSFVVWLAVASVHVLAYLPRLPRLLLARSGAARRLGLIAASVAAGLVLAGGTYSLAGPWLHHHHEPDGDEHTAAQTYLG